MNKMIWFTSTAVLFLLFIVPGILASTLKMIPAADQPGYDSNQRLAIYGKRGVSQKFISHENSLTAIGTSIRNPNLKNKKDIIFSLYDDNKNLIRTSILNGQNFQDGDFTKFVFTPILDSKNKTYLFTLFSPTANPEETIEVFYTGADTSSTLATDTVLEYGYDDKVHPGGLPIVLFRKPDSRWSVVKEIYSNLFSRFLSPGSQKS